ncbi:hypothetical protein V2G26_020680 [Clonostachys chloroleuca]
MAFTKSAWSLVLSAGLSAALTLSPVPPQVDGAWVVSGISFWKSAKYTFENGLPDGLQIANWDTGLNWRADQANAKFNNGYLELWVPGGQNPPTGTKYVGAEVDTLEKNIAYGSFRTVAILTETPGVCNGMFTYGGNTQESDIEWLSDPNNTSDRGVNHLWMTNQAVNGNDADKTSIPVTKPANPFEEHEYRIDWLYDRVEWYVDAVKVAETDQNIPWQGCVFAVNNWSNGDIGWSAGPPAQDAVFKVKSIEMYYNTLE